MSVPSIEKLTSLHPWTVVGVRAGDLLDCLAGAADAATAARTELSTAGDILTDYRAFGTVAELAAAEARLEAVRVGIELHRRFFVDKAWSDANLSGASAEALRDVETQAQSDWQAAWPWFAAALSAAPNRDGQS